jgi:hypothetical protein
MFLVKLSLPLLMLSSPGRSIEALPELEDAIDVSV